MSDQGGKRYNEGKRELIFHEVKENSLKTLSSRCEVVDIKVNEDAIKLISDGKRLADSQPVVTLAWDSLPQYSVPTTCVIEQYGSRGSLFSVTVSQLLKNGNRELMLIVETINGKFNARITAIHDNPMTFCILSQEQYSSADISALEATFRNHVARFSKERFHVEVKSDGKQTQDLSKTSEEMSVSIDLSSPTKKPATRVAPSRSGSDIDDTERQFQEIENSLKTQRNSIEEKFQEQRMQNHQMEETLQLLLKKIEEDMAERFSSLSSGPPSVGNLKTETRGPQLTSHSERRKQLKEQETPKSGTPGPPTAKNEKHSSTKTNESVEAYKEFDRKVDSRRDSIEQKKDFDNQEGRQVYSSHFASRRTSPANGSSPVKASSPTLGSSAPTGRKRTSQDDPGDTSVAKNKTERSQQLRPSAFHQTSFTQRENQENRNSDREKENRDMASQQNTLAREQVARQDKAQPLNESHQGTDHNDRQENIATAGSAEQTNPKRAVTPENFGYDFDMDQYQKHQQMQEEFELMHSQSDGAPPRAKALDTLFCLDTSASMGENGLREMKEIALNILDGIEDIATDHGIEENLAVIQFGGHPIVAQPLTNDYVMVRETIENLQLGGMSPLNDALLMCLQALYGQGGAFSINGVHVVPPRAIVITDGKISTQTEGSVDVDKADVQAKLGLLNILSQLEDKESSGVPNPIFWIPAGKAEEQFLESLGKRHGCLYIKGIENCRKLSSYQRIQIAIGNLFVYIQNMTDREAIDYHENASMILGAIASDLNEEDKEEVLEAVRAKLDGKKGFGNPESSADDFDNIHEDPSFKFPLGTRVTRGPDWKWENQDTGGPGTIINHGKTGSTKEGYVWVEWDNGSYNQYRLGVNEAYDVWEAKDQFRNISSDMSIEVGCEVTRGPDWTQEHGDQDGGCKGVGVVIRNNESGLVRWKENGFIGQYRYSKGGRKEVSIRDPLECFKSLYQPVGTIAETETVPLARRSAGKDSKWVWRWKDDMDQWHLYSEIMSSKLEQEFIKTRGSCLITKQDGQSYRVIFNTMTERGSDSKQRTVERIDINADASSS